MVSRQSHWLRHWSLRDACSAGLRRAWGAEGCFAAAGTEVVHADVVVGVVGWRASVRMSAVLRGGHVLGHAVASDTRLAGVELLPQPSRHEGFRVDAIVLR